MTKQQVRLLQTHWLVAACSAVRGYGMHEGRGAQPYLGRVDNRCKATPKKEGWYLPPTLTKMSFPSCILSTRIASSLQSCTDRKGVT